MNFKEFSEKVQLSKRYICREIYLQNKETIKIKKEETVIKNLVTIFDAVLKISNERGFQAMSMRDLCAVAGISMGALYSYVSSKEELLRMLQETGLHVSHRILEEHIEQETAPRKRLRAAIRTHIYLSEAMQPWFFFSYMEAKNLEPEEKERAVAGELSTEKMMADVLRAGQADGSFRGINSVMMASMIKAMVQDWYLKRAKHAKRGITVDQYADFVIDIVEAYCLPS